MCYLVTRNWIVLKKKKEEREGAAGRGHSMC